MRKGNEKKLRKKIKLNGMNSCLCNVWDPQGCSFLVRFISLSFALRFLESLSKKHSAFAFIAQFTLVALQMPRCEILSTQHTKLCVAVLDKQRVRHIAETYEWNHRRSLQSLTFPARPYCRSPCSRFCLTAGSVALAPFKICRASESTPSRSLPLFF
jgi:hypothetical protein